MEFEFLILKMYLVILFTFVVSKSILKKIKILHQYQTLFCLNYHNSETHMGNLYDSITRLGYTKNIINN